MTARRFGRALLWALPLLLVSFTAGSEERRLNAAEIEALLSDRTAISSGGSLDYKQYFAPTGATTYVQKGRPPSPGRWQADAGKDQYCSYWEPSGWDCYDVFSDGPDSIIWVTPDGSTRYPARLVDGNQL